MYEQTEDYRIGMIEGVLSCYLAEVIDEGEFWATIDYPICAEHDKVLKRLIGFDFLERSAFMKLFEAMPKNPSERNIITLAEIEATPNELSPEDYDTLNYEILEARGLVF